MACKPMKAAVKSEPNINGKRAPAVVKSEELVGFVPGMATPPGGALASISFKQLFNRASIARMVITLEGNIVAANDLCGVMLDLSPAQLEIVKRKETLFTLAHPDTLGAIFHNISLLLNGVQQVTYVIDGKGPVTPKKRLAVCSAMSWLSYGEPALNSKSNLIERPVLIDSIMVQTGWVDPTPQDLMRAPLASFEATATNASTPTGSSNTDSPVDGKPGWEAAMDRDEDSGDDSDDNSEDDFE